MIKRNVEDSFVWKYILTDDQKSKIWLHSYQISLCKMFWLVVGNVIAGLVIGSLIALTVAGGAFLVLYPWVYFGLSFGFGIDVFIFENAKSSLANAVITLSLQAILLVWAVLEAVIPKFFKSVKKSDSLFVEYVKAKKNKVCPIVQFEVEKEKTD